MRTTIRSDSTTVPPVTALRSPPDSRMTGADSPVTADSSTEATPSITSPSPGIRSPASTTTTSPARSAVLGTVSLQPPERQRRRARCVSVWSARRLAACALPRPSATDSASVPNSTVSQSQTVTDQPSTLGSSTERTVVTAAPASTTSITGVASSSRGSSLRRAPGSGARRPGWAVEGAHDSDSTIGPRASTGT